MADTGDERLRALAEHVRAVCLGAVEAAYEDAGLQGLCADGAVGMCAAGHRERRRRA